MWLILRRGVASLPRTMRAWQIESFDSPLQLREVPVPMITKPDQVLVRVKASSVNNIDTVMVKGYGQEVLTQWRRLREWDCDASLLPLIPGRDFSGIVEAVGGNVSNVKKGDEVFGVTHAMEPGCHAEFTITTADSLTRKPESLDHVQAASLPYVSCTAWSAFTFARLHPSQMKGNRILIHGGSGGVGTAAIQMLKALGAPKVVVTCSPDSFELVRSLGGIPVDYKSDSAQDQLITEGPFEVIIDCVNSELSQWSDKILGTWRNCVHVSIVSPMLRDADRYGLPMGLASTAVKYFTRSIEPALQGKWFTYAYFLPSKECLNTVSGLVQKKQMKPIVEQVVPFEDALSAYEKVANLQGRGKTVLKL